MTELYFFVLLCLFHFLRVSDILCRPTKFRKEDIQFTRQKTVICIPLFFLSLSFKLYSSCVVFAETEEADRTACTNTLSSPSFKVQQFKSINMKRKPLFWIPEKTSPLSDRTCSNNDVTVCYNSAYSSSHFLQRRTILPGGESGNISSCWAFSSELQQEKQKVNHIGRLRSASRPPSFSPSLPRFQFKLLHWHECWMNVGWEGGELLLKQLEKTIQMSFLSTLSLFLSSLSVALNLNPSRRYALAITARRIKM